MHILRQSRWLLALVAIDALLKGLAFALLPPHPIDLIGKELQLELTVNYAGFGLQARELLAWPNGPNLFAASTIANTLLALALGGLAYKQLLKAKTVGPTVVGVFLLFGWLASFVSFPTVLGSFAVNRTSQCILLVVIWSIVSSPLWKVGSLLFVAAGIGNFLSLAYPPHGIVDFIWVPLLDRTIGLGVFNFADTLWLGGYIVFFCAAARSIFLRIGSRQGAPAHQPRSANPTDS